MYIYLYLHYIYGQLISAKCLYNHPSFIRFFFFFFFFFFFPTLTICVYLTAQLEAQLGQRQLRVARATLTTLLMHD